MIVGTKYRWNRPSPDGQKALSIAASYNISIPLAHTLVTRGYTEKSLIEGYLYSSYDRDVTHPGRLKGIDRAVERLMNAIEQQEKILIFGDYDVDGITSASLMMACLVPLGASINFHLPHRVKDGYGLSTKVVQRAAKNGYRVIVTVDNGITAFEPAQEAKKHSIDLIITDHHKPHDVVPDAYCIVNPHQADCSYPFKYFAGVGVIFKVMSLLYEKKGLNLPPKSYELLLLGTVADVVPLIGENRFWVRYGLHMVNKTSSFALDVLKESGRCTKAKISSTDIGFRIAPQLNALGRLEDPRQGVQFLLGAEKEETRRIGSILLQLNEMRKKIELGIFDEVRTMIEQGGIDVEKERIILAASYDWPPGVIGLVASRLVGEYGRPAFLLHLTDQGIAKGSCRSIAAMNVFKALEYCKDLLNQFGGHAHAAGLSLSIDNIKKLKVRLEKYAHKVLTPEDLYLSISLDAPLSMQDANKKFIQDCAYLEPFGAENSEPLFYIRDVTLIQPPTLLKNAHIKCMVFADGIIKSVIFFNRPDLFVVLTQQGSRSFDIAAHVTQNEWRWRSSIELVGVDIAIKEDG